MLSLLVFGFVCAIPSSCLSRFPDGNTQNTTFRSETVVTKTDVLRILLNQETLMRMTLVKDVHSLMKDIIDMKVNLATSKNQLHDAMEEISILKSEMNNTLTSIKADVEKSQKSQLNLSAAVSSLSLLNNYALKTKIGFTAGMTTLSSTWRGSTLVFPHVVTNNGNGYNSSTGKFTAPTDGTYVFFVTVTPHGLRALYLDIVQNGVSKVRSMSHGSTAYQMGSNMAVLQLDKGNSVWVRRLAGQSYYSYSVPVTTFSGFLL